MMTEKTLKFTQQQQDVLNCRLENIAVAASAGTGKTTVMVHLIAQLLEEQKVKLDDIAVVTFTESAAAEMRHRLGARLNESSLPQVKRQLLYIDNSDIDTIHAFCVKILKNYFYAIDLNPAFGIVEGGQQKALKAQALDELMDECAASEDEIAAMLFDIFSANRTNKALKEEILKCHEFVVCQADFDLWQKSLDRDYFAILNKTISGQFASCFAQLDKVLSFAQKVGAESIANYCTSLQNWVVVKPTNDFCANYENIASAPSRPRLNSKILIQPDVVEFEDWKTLTNNLEQAAGNLGKLISHWKNRYDKKPYEILLLEAQASKKIANGIISLTLRFKEKYDSLKAKLGVIDFADMEHKTLKLLCNAEICQDITQNLKMMFVDEYQDINKVQEEIIRKLSCSGKLFVVGDIKQAIYGFRQCDSHVFANRVTDYRKNSSGKVLNLDDNWRSHKGILEFVNILFSKNMSEDFGGVNYAGQQLKGAIEAKTALPAVSIKLITKTQKQKSAAKTVYKIEAEQTTENTKAEQEALVIADCINKVVGSDLVFTNGQTRKITYGDIVILTRNGTNFAKSVLEELSKCGIPIVTHYKRDWGKKREILQLISLLRVIDNPFDDISFFDYLSGWFGKLSNEDIFAIRKLNKAVSLFMSVTEFINQNSLSNETLVAATTTNADIMSNGLATAANDIMSKNTGNVLSVTNQTVKKLCAALKQLEDWRFLSFSCTVAELLKHIINSTDYKLCLLGQPDGELKTLRLDSFLSTLSGAQHCSSVDKFLRYYDENGLDEFSNPDFSSANYVTMMTMHRSKGLEFPVVIICGVGEKIADKDKNELFIDKDGGAGAKYFDPSTRSLCSSVPHDAIKHLHNDRVLEEELRLMYVSFTRAKNHLYIIGHIEQDAIGQTVSPPSAKNWTDWLLNIYGDKSVCWEILQQQNPTTVSQNTQTKEMIFKPTDKAAIEQIQNQLNWKYPHLDAIQVPTKLVCSQLDRLSLTSDENEGDEKTVYLNNAHVTKSDLTNTESIEAAKTATLSADAAKVGIAYHKVFEHIDLINPSKENIKETISYLKVQQKTHDAAFDFISIEKIYKCATNPQLVACLKNAQIFRELQFIIGVEYGEVVPKSNCKQQTLLQGVIDLLAICGSKATVVDFKFTTSLHKIMQNYSLQLNAYSIAVKRLLQVKNVRKLVVSITDGEVYEM